MFKNNKYKDLIFAISAIIIVCMIGYKVVDSIDFFGGILTTFVSCSIPFIYGLIIAYVLDAIIRIFERRFKMKRNISILVTYSIVIGIMIIIAIYGMPNLIKTLKDIASDIPMYINTIEDFIMEILNKEEVKDIVSSKALIDNIDSYINKGSEILMAALQGSFSTVISFSSFIVQMFIGILISIYILVDKYRLIDNGKKILFLIFKKDISDKIIEFGRIYHNMIGTYIGIKAIDSTIIGTIAFIGLNIVQSEYALLLAIIVGITNMIPYFGPFVGEIVGFVINVFVSPVKGVLVFLVLFSIQMFDGWYLDPKLVGDKVGVRPICIIYAVVIGGAFLGPIGMLLASATAATLKIYYMRLLKKNNDLIESIEK